jgi:hypothetical protein
MNDPNGNVVTLICDCGHEFAIPVGGLELEAIEYRCPACGTTGRFSDDQIAALVEGHKALTEQASAIIAKAINRGNKRLD